LASGTQIEDACLKPSIQATQKWLRFQAEIINPKLLIPAMKKSYQWPDFFVIP